MYPRTEDNLCSNCDCEVCVCNQYQPTGEIKEGAGTKLRFLTKNFIPAWPKQRRIVPVKLYRYIADKRDKHLYSRCASELVISDDMVSEIEYFLRDGGAEIDGRDIHELVDELLQSADTKNEWFILISAYSLVTVYNGGIVGVYSLASNCPIDFWDYWCNVTTISRKIFYYFVLLMRNAKRNQIVLLLIALHVLVVVAVYWILKRCLHQFGFDINVMQFIALLVLVAIIKRAFGAVTK